MDAETAVEAAKQGSTLVLLDVPEYTLVGIDTQLVSVGPAFKGIKMIPPGPHFVYYSSSSRDGITAFFVCSGPSEVIVRKWDPQQERLLKLAEDEEERYRQAVRNWELDRHLGPYNLTLYGQWKRLSSYITNTIIRRIEPIGGEITVASESALHTFTPKTAKENALDEQLKASRFATSSDTSNARGCYYTSIPHVIKHRGIDVQQLTSLNLDKTQLLESVLQKDYGGSEDMLLGELQFAFVAFLMGQSLEAFLQWKSLVTLLFGCTEAPFHTRSRLFVKEFFLLLQDASVVDGDLLSLTRKLKALLESNFGWEFEQNSAVDGIHFEENDEFAPVVVTLDDPSSTEVPRF